MPARADLHLHTHYSDGTFPPEEVVARAKALGLAAISITDHDNVAAVPQALAAAGPDLEVIPGVELTVVFGTRELHLLGYVFRSDDPQLAAFLARMQRYRVERIQAMIERLRAHRVTVTLEEVLEIAGKGSVGRPHLAEALVKRRAVRSLEEAFKKYLGDDAPCFVKGATVTMSQGTELIRGAGGVAVLAHPFRMVADSWFPELVAAGIQGVEVFHSDHDPSAVKRYLDLARQHHLLVTGGSDCHGLRHSHGPLIGTVTVPYDLVERLKAAASG